MATYEAHAAKTDTLYRVAVFLLSILFIATAVRWVQYKLRLRS